MVEGREVEGDNDSTIKQRQNEKKNAFFFSTINNITIELELAFFLLSL